MTDVPIYAQMGERTGDGEAGVAAGWWSRVGATLLDGLILLIPLIIVGVVVGSDAAGVTYAITLLISLLYAPLLMARTGDDNGQTLGKQALGIRVRHESGEPMTFGRGVLRDFVGKTVLGLTVIYTLVDSLWPLWDKRNQALHDKIGSTRVVKA